MEEIKLFEQRSVRSHYDEEQEKWYFSIIDVIAVLTESANAGAYWRKLKQRLKEEGNETVTNCHSLKMRSIDGKMRMTDVADVEQLFRLIQSIPSPKADRSFHIKMPSETFQTAFLLIHAPPLLVDVRSAAYIHG